MLRHLVCGGVCDAGGDDRLRPFSSSTGLSGLSTSTILRRAAMSDPVSALVLVLRPSRSLHHLHTRDRQVVFHRFSAFSAPSGIWIDMGMVLSLIAVGFLSFGLWVHHMFATGLPKLGASFFTASSMMIAIPNGIQIFCWLATLWEGRTVTRYRCSSYLVSSSFSLPEGLPE